MRREYILYLAPLTPAAQQPAASWVKYMLISLQRVSQNIALEHGECHFAGSAPPAGEGSVLPQGILLGGLLASKPRVVALKRERTPN